MSEPNEVKLVVVGETGVGKTTLLQRYAEGKVEEQLSTIGACCMEKAVEVNSRTYNLSLWDTAGQEAYRAIVPMYFRGASIALIVADITNEKSLETIPYWINLVHKNLSTENPIVSIVVNKIDLKESQVMTEGDILSTYHTTEMEVFFTSAIANIGVDTLFDYLLNKYDNLGQPTDDNVAVAEISRKDSKTSHCMC
ncbi:small GTP-binding protein, putative [Trichomonas vaginalis G3]|uniref:Small GTP-binding protein, putative n=1 Tax=Trichomonas vaginalis (strain ATCC PRA-98 / G3) TaxID=412133 RepID=A2E5I7_TRIV3|nr:GTPase protein [Trichomonas vaginalis G3]EAY12028.1 small GTP-binding protein, putative [Trichomonas vaginalis G3]KAI5485499.1 GTPase protein [Trichomonas vaginalis G3]|eukprot:XP_001324251.1 small GTP-binding protein [Trichomonas vaginalis G3]